MKRLSVALFCLAALALSCGGGGERYDRNVSVPKGDPDFPSLGASWVIDRAGVLADTTVAAGDAVCERLRRDGIAEVVVVVIKGVRRPEDWATHYGRWLGLGAKGLSTGGGNNGLVWLVRPDAEKKLTVSVGRGLPRFTTVDYGPVMDEAIEYFNFNNYNGGVAALLDGTDRVLRKTQAPGNGERKEP